MRDVLTAKQVILESIPYNFNSLSLKIIGVIVSAVFDKRYITLTGRRRIQKIEYHKVSVDKDDFIPRQLN